MFILASLTVEKEFSQSEFVFPEPPSLPPAYQREPFY